MSGSTEFQTHNYVFYEKVMALLGCESPVSR